MEKTFSQRFGFKPVKNIIQSESMDNDLKNGLWNLLITYYWDKAKGYVSCTGYDQAGINDDFELFFKLMWHNHFKRSFDTLDYGWNRNYSEIKKYFFSCKWYEIYDFIEFVSNNGPNERTNNSFITTCNHLLKKELSAYRFVNGKLVRITSDEEIAEIEEAQKVPISPVRTHLKTALGLLADRENPDYRNSIKESISAVEALCQQITGNKNATLGDALKQIEIEDKVDLHGALKAAFSQIYGYTSDECGIRHALSDEANLDFEDAKFMLVACSAFTNYLYTKADKANIKLSE